MAEIIEFPKQVTTTAVPQNNPQAWEERTLASLKASENKRNKVLLIKTTYDFMPLGKGYVM